VQVVFKNGIHRLQVASGDTLRTPVADIVQTGVTILLPHDQERHMLTYPGTIAALCVAELNVDCLTRTRQCHLSSLYLQRGLHNRLADLLCRLKQAGLTISLDTNDDPGDLWGLRYSMFCPVRETAGISRANKAGVVHFDSHGSDLLISLNICVPEIEGRFATRARIFPRSFAER
jgi:hypothetical protein